MEPWSAELQESMRQQIDAAKRELAEKDATITRLEADSLTLKRVRAVNPELLRGIENHYAKCEARDD